MLKVKVSNMTSNNGNKVVNQLLIYTDEGVYFQSYNTVIAFRDHQGNVTLDKDAWNYSRTTGKYRNIFLRESTKVIEKRIASGEYRLENLN